jgi:hypothetical protein
MNIRDMFLHEISNLMGTTNKQVATINEAKGSLWLR